MIVGIVATILVTIVLLVGLALVLPAMQQAREAARREQVKNNLRQIGLALQNYHDVQFQFPQSQDQSASEDHEADASQPDDPGE